MSGDMSTTASEDATAFSQAQADLVRVSAAARLHCNVVVYTTDTQYTQLVCTRCMQHHRAVHPPLQPTKCA
jgi:hypothetical protein